MCANLLQLHLCAELFNNVVCVCVLLCFVNVGLMNKPDLDMSFSFSRTDMGILVNATPLTVLYQLHGILQISIEYSVSK